MKGSELRSFVEETPFAMAMFDRDMRYLTASGRWRSERNLDNSVFGRTAYEVHPEVAPIFRDAHLRALAGETVLREEDRIETAHGVVQWVRSEIRPWHEADGQIGGVVVFAENITAQKQAEEALRKSEERYRYAIEASNEGIWDWYVQEDKAVYSPAYYHMLGYDASEWKEGGVNIWIGSLHPEERDRIVTTARALLASVGRYALEFRLRAKDGSWRWIMSRGKVVERDETGAPVRAVGTHTDITDRKQAEEVLLRREEELRQKHEELEAIYNNVPVGLCLIDANLRYRRINQRLAEINGLAVEKHLGRTVGEVVPALADEAQRVVEIIRRTGEPVIDVECSGVTDAAPGVTRVWNESWRPVTAKDGSVTAYAVVVEEITEKKKTELRLKQTSERLEMAQSAARIGVWDWDLTTNESFVNEQWRSIYGLLGDAVLTYEDFLARVHPADRDVFAQMERQALSGGGKYEGEMRIIRADDGATRWVSHKGVVFFGSQGRPIRAMGAVWDITSLKQAQDALLKRAEDRYRMIVETAQEGVWLLDENARTTFVNPKMAQLLGYAPEEMLGRDLLDFSDDEWADVARQKLIDRTAGVVETHDFKFRRKDGSALWALLSCAPIFEGADYHGALAMVMDFTDRKRLEEERQRYLDELRQADRRKDEFLATLGHELRTPLATIKLATDVMATDDYLMETFGALFARVQRQVGHLTRMVDEVLQVSRATRGKIELQKEPLDINVLLAQVVEGQRARFTEKGIGLNVRLEEQTLPVSGDGMRLTQVFANLLDNAAKYTDQGGKVDLTASRKGDHVVVTVRDTGIGIPPEQLTWIFELFAQIKNGPERVREGIGVGLALARKLVELHGGAMEAKSEGIGKGSAFIVRLPLAVQNAAAQPLPAAGEDRGGAGGATSAG